MVKRSIKFWVLLGSIRMVDEYMYDTTSISGCNLEEDVFVFGGFNPWGRKMLPENDLAVDVFLDYGAPEYYLVKFVVSGE